MKTIISDSFVTRYPFQNFLPVMPPANYETNYPMTGVQAVRVTNPGTGYRAIDNSNLSATIHTAPNIPGTDAPHSKCCSNRSPVASCRSTSSTGGSGYPNGNPSNT